MATLATAFKAQENLFRLKARTQWLRLGESNSKIFHAIFRRRCNSNFIGAIEQTDGSLNLDPFFIKDQAVAFISSLYNGASTGRNVSELHCNALSEEALLQMNHPFTFEVLQSVVLAADPDKAPGQMDARLPSFKSSGHLSAKRFG